MKGLNIHFPHVAVGQRFHTRGASTEDRGVTSPLREGSPLQEKWAAIWYRGTEVLPKGEACPETKSIAGVVGRLNNGLPKCPCLMPIQDSDIVWL